MRVQQECRLGEIAARDAQLLARCRADLQSVPGVGGRWIGVEVDLIVRGICCLRPGIPGVSDRIRVVSIVGRFLEHTRLFYFANGGDDQFYFGSADWMPRNFDRRVEAVAPVDDVTLQPRLHSLLAVCLSDNRQAWDLAADGTYIQRLPNGEPVRATHQLLLVDPWGMVKPAEAKRMMPGVAASS